MEIKSATSGYNANQAAQTEGKKERVEVKSLYTEKLSTEESSALREQIKMNSMAFTMQSTSVQSNIFNPNQSTNKDVADFQSFLKDIGYEGKPIASLSQDEASALVSADGFFGIDKTAQRIADFVINGSGGNEDLLRAGREGMLRGFDEAEEVWGGKLPDISQQTMTKATELVDKAMSDLGFSILNTEA